MGEYLTKDERLRRIGDLLLKGVYLWAEATEGGAAVVREDVEMRANGRSASGEVCPPSRAPHAVPHPNVSGRPGSDERMRRPTIHNVCASARDESGQGARAPDAVARTRLRCLPGPGPMEDFAVQFDDVFRTPAQRRGFRTYLEGLLSRREQGKSLTTLAGHDSAAGMSAAPMQRLQYFLCESAWDTDRLAARRLELLAAARATVTDGAGTLVIDDATGHKAGGATAPLTLRSLWADDRVYCPLHLQPHSRAQHTAAGKVDVGLRSRSENVMALVEGARAMGIAFRAVVTNCSHSEFAHLAKALQWAKVPYVLAVEPSDDFSATPDAAHMLDASGETLRRRRLEAPAEWEPIVRRVGDGREEKWWAAERHRRPNERRHPQRALIATTDPLALRAASTWYLVTNLPQPGSLPPGEVSLAPAGLLEVVRLYGLYQSVTQSYRQVRQELGWDDVMVRSPLAMRRHWELACCALLFCWQVRLAEEAAGSGETTLVASPDVPISFSARCFIGSAWQSALESWGSQMYFNTGGATSCAGWDPTAKHR
ncbi:MAG: transposase [Dehalococcoidales bacterium]|nr:transposase [Dehalococcoidales bacterium]